MPEFAIETSQLSYSFHTRSPVVNQVSLQVPRGTIYGFLGPNGAGKTTTIRLLAGMLFSGEDNIYIQGRSLQQNIPEVFRQIGTLIETPSLYLHLTARENLKIITLLRGLPDKKITHILEVVGLTAAANRRVKEYSLGMKQRLGIAMALMPDPDLLMLDEPVNGLDPSGIVEVRELLKKLNREEGKTIFVSSHLLNEVERTCTHIGIINKGILRYQGTLEDMKKTALASGEAGFTIQNASHWMEKIQQSFGGAKKLSDDQVSFPFGNQHEVVEINRSLTQMGIPVSGINVHGGLEDWFMKIIANDKNPAQ